MSLSVLTDEQICGLLEGLTIDELEEFRDCLKSALHEYSTGIQVQDGEIHQPERTSMRSSITGATTLFMPSCSPAGLGVKVITLTTPDAAASTGESAVQEVIRPTGAITLFHPNGRPAGILHASTLTAFRTALASVCLVIRRNTVKTVTVFGCGEQAYWHVRLALLTRGSTIKHVNIINRRFSAGCKLILKRFNSVPAAQRECEGWPAATIAFGVLTPGYVEFARLLREQIRAADVIFCCTPSTQPLFEPSILTSHEARRKGRLIVAVGSYAPHMRELPAELLLQATRTYERSHHHFHKHAIEGGVVIVDTLDGALKEAGEILEAGLQPRQLIELGELVMLQRIAMAEDDSDTSSSVSTAPSSEFDKLDLSSAGSSLSLALGPSSSFSSSAAATAVDSAPSSRNPSPSGSGRRSLSSKRRRNSSYGGGSAADRQKQKDSHFACWLQGGNVIYKSVGLGLMDLTVGMHLIEFAREKGVGSHVEGF